MKLLSLFFFVSALSAETYLEVDLQQAETIADQIWENEANKREDLLTFWNEKEEFPSIGIGHFIWPAKNYRGPFEEGRFHLFLAFAEKQGALIPEWLKESQQGARYCPWDTKQIFYAAFNSSRMQELRTFLVKERALQAQYMIVRFNENFPNLVKKVPFGKRDLFWENFKAVRSQKAGAYVLIDYLNFKGEGTDPRQRYRGDGWGLLQVLVEMDSQKEPIEAFEQSCVKVLERRVRNSPNPQIDASFLPGWKKRLNTYRKVASKP